MSVISVNKENFEGEVLRSEKKVLLDFYADWCNPCRALAPVIDGIANEHPEYKIAKVNVDEQSELAGEYKIMSIPTLVVIEDGKVASRSVGTKTKSEILSMLK